MIEMDLKTFLGMFRQAVGNKNCLLVSQKKIPISAICSSKMLFWNVDLSQAINQL